MKTIVTILTIVLSTTMLMAKAQPCSSVNMQDVLAMTEEAYVNDIPFDTWLVSREACPESLMVMLPEEAYVDDIPFDTELIAGKALLNTVMEEEKVVNDIPVSTQAIYNEIMLEVFIAQWLAEKSYVPFLTFFISSP